MIVKPSLKLYTAEVVAEMVRGAVDTALDRVANATTFDARGAEQIDRKALDDARVCADSEAHYLTGGDVPPEWGVEVETRTVHGISENYTFVYVKEITMTTFTVEHIDDCLPCYLTDYHNREGECLIGVPVDATTTVQQVFDALYGEAVDAELPDGVTAEQIAEACGKEVFGVLTPSEAWNSDLEVDENDGDGPQAWFVLRWEV